MNYGLRELFTEAGAYTRDVRVPYIEYNESGDWERWLPKYEPQAENYETYACTVWASLNQLETLCNFLYNVEPNYAERFNALLVGLTGEGGTDPQKAHESIRKDGVVGQTYCPIPDRKEEFFNNSIITGSLLAKGQNWLVFNDYLHEWLWSSSKDRPSDWKDLLRESLKTSPIAVSVSAWNREGDVYVSHGDVNNHYCMLYKIDDEGYMWVFDSYNHHKKKLAKDHNIRRAKRIWTNRKTTRASRQHVSILKTILKALLMRKTLYDVCRDALGTDVTPLDAISDDVACAEVVTTLMKKAGVKIPVIPGTYTLYQWLKNPENGYRQVPHAGEGDIVISPTGTGKAGAVGHVGVVMEDDTIASNTSFGMHSGKFIKNYTVDTWTRRYKDGQGMPVLFYRRVL